MEAILDAMIRPWLRRALVPAGSVSTLLALAVLCADPSWRWTSRELTALLVAGALLLALGFALERSTTARRLSVLMLGLSGLGLLLIALSR